MSETLDKVYNPVDIENKWYPIWETSAYFKPSMKGKPFCLMIPPPNVTGSLHMGHAFEATIMDTLTRFHRMSGHNTLWQVGTDHAGIATQMLVERQLEREHQTRHTLGREAFIDKIWAWKETSGNTITQQLRRMGASVDWTRERFTMDEGLSAAVQEVFIRLYKEGLIYRGNRLVNWDPVLQTAISDLEVVSEEEAGHLWHIRYPVVGTKESLVVATTRPETLFGDAAVAVHPEDARYQHLIGKKVQLPLTDRQIPIIADDYVDIQFGTGCLKITPAHDFNDYEVGMRHELTSLNIFTAQATLNEEVPIDYQGLDRFVARKKVVEQLTLQKFLVKIVDHKLTVPRGDRSGAVIEPFMTHQWYVKIKPLAEPAIKAVEDKEIRFIPEQWENTYFAWMRDIQDWCISRQLWWGHRIPAWYDEEGKVYVGKNEDAIRVKHQLSSDMILKQDEDVLDTWFSSALWPFSTLGWPEKTAELKAFYPTNVLVTGFDIIFFWVARMIMFGLKFTGKVPFKDVYIHGLIRDSEGKKMSKSKGNVLDPLDIIDGISSDALVTKRTKDLMQPQMAEKIAKKTAKEFPEGIKSYGTDALRMTFASLASTGRNIQFDFNRLEGYRNFCNKLWNASRYIMMNIETSDNDLGDEAIQYSVADRWIHSILQEVISRTSQHLRHYRFDLAAQTLYDFTWHELCDWYLELSKPILQNEKVHAVQKRGTQQTLIEVFETLLRLLHPIIPFITEEIWQKIAPLSGRNETKTIMQAKYPIPENQYQDKDAEREIEWLKAIMLAIRNIRGEMNISPAKPIPVLLVNGTDQDQQYFEKNKEYLTSLTKLASIRYLKPDETLPPSATGLVGALEIKVPVAGLINIDEEALRLQRELKKVQQELDKAQNKLDNPNYVSKAPAAVVEQERARVAAFQQHISKLSQQLATLTNSQ